MACMAKRTRRHPQAPFRDLGGSAQSVEVIGAIRGGAARAVYPSPCLSRKGRGGRRWDDHGSGISRSSTYWRGVARAGRFFATDFSDLRDFVGKGVENNFGVALLVRRSVALMETKTTA